MGFFQRVFSKDPRRDLERAEALLASGDAQRALELARRAEARALHADKNRAEILVGQARRTLVATALEKASAAEESEFFEDAVEWLEVALEHDDNPARQSEMQTLRRSLLERAREVEDEAWEPEPEVETETSTNLHPGAHYQALVDMLVEGVAERYEDRPSAFRAAYVAFNEGRVAEAHASFDKLATAAAEDPVIRFERGRCRLASGQPAGAASDFETAWPALGDAPLDLTGELSVPVLWAEAMLAGGRPRPVIERLAELADPVAAAPLCERYAQALLVAERFTEARDFLAAAIAGNPVRPVFGYQLARALDQLGERPAAIDCLETAIAPSCTTGCAPRAKHLPSLRALASLYMDDDSHPERVRELMTIVAQSLGGHLTGRDHSLLARYYQQIGDDEAAEKATAEAGRLSEEAEASLDTEEAPAPPAQGAQMRAPL